MKEYGKDLELQLKNLEHKINKRLKLVTKESDINYKDVKDLDNYGKLAIIKQIDLNYALKSRQSDMFEKNGKL